MKAFELQEELHTMTLEISRSITACLDNLEKHLETITNDNEAAIVKVNMHKAMAEYVVHSMLASKYKKATDKNKTIMDILAMEMGIDTEAITGTTKKIYEDEVLVFNKKRNSDTDTISATDLSIELNKLGIDGAMLETAKKNATKTRKGNTYYDVVAAE